MISHIVEVRTYFIGYTYQGIPSTYWKKIGLSGRWKVSKRNEGEPSITFETTEGKWHNSEELRVTRLEEYINECSDG